MNLRTIKWALIAYVLFDLLLGYAGVFPLEQLAAAQFTTVTGTVLDPNNIPYAFGTITPILVTTASPTLNGLAYSPPTQPIGLDKNGSFAFNVADNTQLLPAGTKWNFTVCSAVGTVQPAIGTGSQCFSLAAPITISGATQSITANLNAVSLALTVTNTSGGTTINPTNNVIPKRSNATTFVDSCFTDDGTTATCNNETLADVITSTTTSGTLNGFSGNLTANPSGASSQTLRNLILVSTQAGNAQNISGRNIGLNLGVTHSGNGNLTAAVEGLAGIVSTVSNAGTGSITDQKGLSSKAFNTSSGAGLLTSNSAFYGQSGAGGATGVGATITNDYTYRADPPGTTANHTMTHHYAFWANSPQTGGTGNPDGWAFFSAGSTDKSQFGFTNVTLLQKNGVTFGATGCAVSALVGGATAGQFTSGTTGACTVTITMGNSAVATNAWTCHSNDLTTPGNAISQTTGGTATSQAILTGTTVSGDIIRFSCDAF